tara:strand:+ start:297 stop:506 length:210 start_codon:yes stop_codon:yes gene_type:complete
MTVKQLIEHLQTLDPELRVFRLGYEGGLEDVIGTNNIIDVELDYNEEWYYGPHEELNSETPNSVKGIVL